MKPGFATCPGCGDFGDAHHITACAVLAKDEITSRGFRRGADFVLAAVKTQLGRRGGGGVDLAALADMIDAIAPKVGNFRGPR